MTVKTVIVLSNHNLFTETIHFITTKFAILFDIRTIIIINYLIININV